MIHTFVIKILPGAVTRLTASESSLRADPQALHGLLTEVASGDQYPFTSGEMLLALLCRITEPQGSDDTLPKPQTETGNNTEAGE